MCWSSQRGEPCWRLRAEDLRREDWSVTDVNFEQNVIKRRSRYLQSTESTGCSSSSGRDDGADGERLCSGLERDSTCHLAEGNSTGGLSEGSGNLVEGKSTRDVLNNAARVGKGEAAERRTGERCAGAEVSVKGEVDSYSGMRAYSTEPRAPSWRLRMPPSGLSHRVSMRCAVCGGGESLQAAEETIWDDSGRENTTDSIKRARKGVMGVRPAASRSAVVRVCELGIQLTRWRA